ncbi:MAG: DegT/DnrJ/EryC1/StrS family aminotransferase [Flavobacteriales bacterium]|nr:DegT/DnrJ/EryC1/StrS family aminotransferase [Flavobacteriales bacterium]
MAAYLKAEEVIACGNGTDALQIAMMALGLKPGDEVITPSFTFVATVEVVALLGSNPFSPMCCPVHSPSNRPTSCARSPQRRRPSSQHPCSVKRRTWIPSWPSPRSTICS